MDDNETKEDRKRRLGRARTRKSRNKKKERDLRNPELAEREKQTRNARRRLKHKREQLYFQYLERKENDRTDEEETLYQKMTNNKKKKSKKDKERYNRKKKAKQNDNTDNTNSSSTSRNTTETHDDNNISQPSNQPTEIPNNNQNEHFIEQQDTSVAQETHTSAVARREIQDTSIAQELPASAVARREIIVIESDEDNIQEDHATSRRNNLEENPNPNHGQHVSDGDESNVFATTSDEEETYDVDDDNSYFEEISSLVGEVTVTSDAVNNQNNNNDENFTFVPAEIPAFMYTVFEGEELERFVNDTVDATRFNNLTNPQEQVAFIEIALGTRNATEADDHMFCDFDDFGRPDENDESKNENIEHDTNNDVQNNKRQFHGVTCFKKVHDFTQYKWKDVQHLDYFKDYKCPVCLNDPKVNWSEDEQETRTLIQLKCGGGCHWFCSRCIKYGMIKKCTKCPNCRTPYRYNSSERYFLTKKQKAERAARKAAIEQRNKERRERKRSNDHMRFSDDDEEEEEEEQKE